MHAIPADLFPLPLGLLTGRGVPQYSEGSPAAEDEKAHVFCKADPSAVDMYPLFNDPTFRLGLEKLMKAAAVEGRVICLMCGCLRPHKCHRSRLIGDVCPSLHGKRFSPGRSRRITA